MIDVVDGLVQEIISILEFDDPLEHCMLNDSSMKDANPEIAMYVQFLKTLHKFPLRWLKRKHW